MKLLIAKTAFGNYQLGDRITDAAEIQRILASEELTAHVLQTNEVVAPAATAASTTSSKK